MAEKACKVEQTLEIKSHGRNLAQVRSFVEEIANTCGFDNQQIFDIKVAVGEACSNAIEHGSPRGEESRITVRCYCTATDFVVEVADEGRFKQQLPTLNSSAESFRGRGVLLMLALMDKVSIDESENGTIVYLSKRLK